MIKPIGIEILGVDSEEGRALLQGLPVEELAKKDDLGESGKSSEAGAAPQEEDEFKILEPGELEIEDIKEEEHVKNTQKTSDILAFAKDLYEEGLISLDEEEELESFTKTELLTKINDSIDAKNKAYKAEYAKKFSGAKKKFLEIEDSFADENEAMVYANDLNILDKIGDEDIEGNPQLAEWVISRTLAYRGADNKEIQERIEEIKDLGKLDARAKEYAPKLKKSLDQHVEAQRQKVEARRQAEIEKEKEQYESLLSAVDSIEEIIPGLDMTKRMKSTMKTKMTKVVHTDERGNQYNELGYKQLQNPQEFNIAIEWLNAIGMMNFDQKGRFKPDMKILSKLMNKEIKKSIDNLVSEEQKLGAPGNIAQESSSKSKRLEFFQEMAKAVESKKQF